MTMPNEPTPIVHQDFDARRKHLIEEIAVKQKELDAVLARIAERKQRKELGFMTLDYDDLEIAAKAHALLRLHQLKITFVPNRPSSTIPGAESRVFHRIIVTDSDADEANDLLRQAGLSPPL